MVDVLVLLWSALTSLFRSRVRLEAEIPVLREQISVLRRTSPKRFAFGIFDRWVFVGLYRLVPGIVDALSIVRPETVIRWHPCWISIVLALEIQTARRETENPAGDTSANPGHEPGQPALGRTPHPRRTAHARHRCRPDKRCKVHGPEEGRAITGWRTFLCNHADDIASMDLFVVPTLSFRLLYGFLILRHRRRRFMWLGVTANPTAEWIARQVREARGWEAAPDYVVRDRDRVYGETFIRRLHAMGIRDRPTAPRSPWQNAYAERLIGSIRKEALDHVVVLGERHVRQVLSSYLTYHNEARTHLSLDKDASVPRAVQGVGRIFAKLHL